MNNTKDIQDTIDKAMKALTLARQLAAKKRAQLEQDATNKTKPQSNRIK